MDYTFLNMQSYKRKEHFAYFSNLAYPYVGMTVNIEIHEFLECIKTAKMPFFLSFCYCVCKAANRIPEFRQRIVDGKIVEFDRCQTSHTVALEDGTYCYCTLDGNMPFSEYIAYAALEQEKAKVQNSIEESPSDILNKFFISTLPWVSFTALVQPVPFPADSNPRITWGKYEVYNGKVQLPVSVLCHHALVDGIHIAAFYRALEQELAVVLHTIG